MTRVFKILIRIVLLMIVLFCMFNYFGDIPATYIMGGALAILVYLTLEEK